MAPSSLRLRALSTCIAVFGPACERGEPKADTVATGEPGDTRWVGIRGVKGLPTLRVRVPRFIEPFNILDPPAVFMFFERRPVDQPFHASVALQPAAKRVSPPHCGLAGIATNAEATRAHQVLGPGLETWRCEGTNGQRGVIIDRRLEDASSGASYYCIAIWSWDGPGPIAAEWNAVIVAIEQACHTLVVVDDG